MKYVSIQTKSPLVVQLYECITQSHSDLVITQFLTLTISQTVYIYILYKQIILLTNCSLTTFWLSNR